MAGIVPLASSSISHIVQFACSATPPGVWIALICMATMRRMWPQTEAVRNFWLLVGPKLRNRPEQWPRVRLPAPEPEPEVVESERPVRFPAEPFVCGPHLHVNILAHETYAICLDCQRHVGVHTGRGRLNYHAWKGRACKPLISCLY
eukprot:2444259-Amphidinium_carterae.1